MLEESRYEATYSPLIQRYLKKVTEKRLKEVFIKVREEILLYPEKGNAKSTDLAGIFTKSFSYAGTQYRIAYRVFHTEKTIYFILAGSRECFYDELKRYLKNTG